MNELPPMSEIVKAIDKKISKSKGSIDRLVLLREMADIIRAKIRNGILSENEPTVIKFKEMAMDKIC